ncbi:MULTISPECIES: PTS system mannose/fructose/sorbose family transporter subunit IID [Enorma]|uniref:PTS system mannose/fructose/sorbose family transporter subunit IID n=1 Tax=Enorma TaxID=1472762 RepID=UPI00034BB496|nr:MULTISPECIES: PTS system mannose/fructose/sorbose family transporter subunit IID [Enorma]
MAENATETKLSKKTIARAYWSWMFFNLSVQNFERMQGPAVVKMLGDVREDLYPGDPEAQKKMLARHANFFNTEPYLGSLVPGVILGMEASKAEGADVPDELIDSIKTALMGPFAGIGDSLLPGTIIPILLSIALGLSPNGELLGPIFYVVVFLAIMLPLTRFLFTYGARTGASAASALLESGIKDRIVSIAQTVGLVVVGAVTASYTQVNIGLVFTSGDLTIDIASIFSTLMPGLPVLLMAFLAYFLMVKKKWSANRMILFFLIVAIVGYFTTILTVSAA